MVKKSNIPSVGELVKQCIEKLDREKVIDEDSLLATWKDIAGEKGFKHSRPIALYKNTLKVIVDNPGWIQQLTINKRTLLKKLQSQFGKDKISDIRFKIGEL